MNKITPLEVNAEQAAIVQSDANQIIALANPGAGKTRTIIARIAWLVNQGVEPQRIVCISFTNAASQEMADRLNLAGLTESLGFCGTLHSFLLRQLQRHHALLNLASNLSVIDDEQKEPLVESIMADMGVRVSIKKIMPLVDASPLEPTMVATKENLVAKEYHLRLRRDGLLDYNTVLWYGLALLKKLTSEQFGYTHLLWDEMQDAATVDFEILRAMPCLNKMIVGDSDQQIFSFRNANGKPCDEFVRLAKNNGCWIVHTLLTNYRCPQAICAAADRLISHNADRFEKHCVASRVGGFVESRQCANPAAELATVAHEIGKIPAEDLNHTAVLCRTNALATQFADYLAGIGLPVVRKKQVQVPADWRRAKLLLAVLANPTSEQLARQYIRSRDGDAKLAELERIAAKELVSICRYTFNSIIEAPLVYLRMKEEAVSDESINRIEIVAMKLPPDHSISDLLLAINAHEDEDTEGDGISVVTCHASKGREWKHVFLPGWEERMFPSVRIGTDLQEERRLAFVSLTRASQTVLVTWCAERSQNRGQNVRPGPMEPREPSRFIAEAGI